MTLNPSALCLGQHKRNLKKPQFPSTYLKESPNSEHKIGHFGDSDMLLWTPWSIVHLVHFKKIKSLCLDAQKRML